MKNIIKKIILSLAIIAGSMFIASPAITSEPVYAAGNGEACTCTIRNDDGTTSEISGTKVPTTILDACDCGHGEGVMTILSLVVRIMTIGIGILGTIGIIVVGIQYLTAGGSEEQTKKAKRRMYEIVIGLAVYILAYAILSWLLPGFQPF